MNTEQFIRDCAARGWSRHMTADAMGLTYAKFKPMADAMPDVKWPRNGTSLANKAANHARKGEACTIPAEACARGRKALIDRVSVEAFGVKDSILGHCRRHGISQATVWCRRQKGWTLEQALSTPPTPRHLRKAVQ